MTTIERTPATDLVWTIPDEAAVSNSLQLLTFAKGSFRIPATIDAGNFTIQVSDDDVTFTTVKDSANVAVGAVAMAANTVFRIYAGAFEAKYARLASSVNQTNVGMVCPVNVSG